jgi:LysR family cyn operon transcriptional activator
LDFILKFISTFVADLNNYIEQIVKKDMELRQLKYFQKVAELQNFSEASRQLNITQSTLSQQIKKLEDELNVTLLLRDSHHVQLTDIGEAILPAINRTLRDANACKEIINDVQELNYGTLTIGATQSFTLLLKETILDFMKLYPGIKLTIHCQAMEQLMQMLDKEEIDIAISYRPKTPLFDTIESRTLFSSQLCVVVSETHPLAYKDFIRLSELEQYNLALPTKGTQARNTFDVITKNMELRLKIGVEVSAIHMLLDLVRGTRFVTVLSKTTILQYDGLKAIPIKHPGCGMEGSYHIRKGAYLKRATRQFLQMLSEKNSFNLSLEHFLN